VFAKNERVCVLISNWIQYRSLLILLSSVHKEQLVKNLIYPRAYSVHIKELSFCHKLWFYNRHIFSIWWCKPLIYQTFIIWSKEIHSLKYLRSPTVKWKDIGKRKSEFVTKTQFLYRVCIIPLRTWIIQETIQVISSE